MCEGGFVHIVQSQKEACHMEVPKFRESYAGPKLQSDVHQGTPLHVRGVATGHRGFMSIEPHDSAHPTPRIPW